MDRYRAAQVEIKNYLREKNVSGIVSLLQGLRAFSSADEMQKLSSLSSVLSHFPSLPGTGKLCRLGLDLASSKGVYPATDGEVVLTNSIILKPYISPREKGFLLVSFEKELEKILSSGLLSEVEKRYYIIFIPSWSGLFSPPLFALAARSQFPFFVMPVHQHERSSCKLLGDKCVDLPFNAASWVNAELFDAPAVERDIDCLMIANFAEFKRHWLLFKALRGLPGVHAVCVGVPLGSRTVRTLQAEASLYGVSERVQIVENPSQEELRSYYRRAKVFCALSFREGSFIAVAEALTAGTPVVMFENAHIGTKALITRHNGALISSVSELKKAILHFRKGAEYGRIRSSAVSGNSSTVNCSQLSALLKSKARELGEEWSRDIENVFSVRLEFYYHNDSDKDAFEADYEFFSNLGIRFKQASLA